MASTGDRGLRLRGRVRRTIRTADIGELQDVFLVSAVVMILVIRLQLFLTHYPQLGGGKLHIAHLLWGGLLMLIAIGILLSFLGRSIRTPAAVIGGIGFGFFIDELGKFITEDNDYFFKPAAGIIYLLFIVLFLITRAMQNRRGLTPHEYLVNAIDMVTEAARRDLNEGERRRALAMLDRADPDDPLVVPTHRLLREIEAVPTPAPRFYEHWALAVRDFYSRIVDTKWFPRLIGAVFVIWALGSVVEILTLVLAAGFALEGADDVPVRLSDLLEGDSASFVSVASLAASVVVGVLVIAGGLRLRARDRMGAYRLFERAMLVQIFVADFFSFVESEFSAVFGMAIDVLLLITVRFMIRREREREIAAGPPVEAPPRPIPEAARAG
jgi:hypothetical protein